MYCIHTRTPERTRRNLCFIFYLSFLNERWNNLSFLIDLHSPDSSSLFHVNRRIIFRQMCLSIGSLKTEKFLIKGDCCYVLSYNHVKLNAQLPDNFVRPFYLEPSRFQVLHSSKAQKKPSLFTIKALLEHTYCSNRTNAMHNHCSEETTPTQTANTFLDAFAGV